MQTRKTTTRVAAALLFLGLILLAGTTGQSQTADDLDGDGVGNLIDNCVLVANPGQQDANSSEEHVRVEGVYDRLMGSFPSMRGMSIEPIVAGG